MFREEESIEKEQFQLYGSDLRILTNQQFIITAIYYNSPIESVISEIKNNVVRALTTPCSSILRRCIINRIGDNLFKYDSCTKLEDVFETTEKSDVHAIYRSFDKSKYLYRIYASTISKIVCVVFCHAIFDGVSAVSLMNAMCGTVDKEIIPIEKPNILLRAIYSFGAIATLPFFLSESQLTKDFQTPRFNTQRISIKNIKRLKNITNTNFVSSACSIYLSHIFKLLPKSVTQLKVLITVYVRQENRFNNYNVIPIIVQRDKCSSNDINDNINCNKKYMIGLFELYEMFCNCLHPNSQSNKTLSLSDVCFSLMKTNCDVGNMKKKKTLVYNYSSSSLIYACGLQTGPKYFYISSSIQTSMCRLG